MAKAEHRLASLGKSGGTVVGCSVLGSLFRGPERGAGVVRDRQQRGLCHLVGEAEELCHRRLVREVLLGLGISEAMPNPFLAPDTLAKAGLPTEGG